MLFQRYGQQHKLCLLVGETQRLVELLLPILEHFMFYVGWNCLFTRRAVSIIHGIFHSGSVVLVKNNKLVVTSKIVGFTYHASVFVLLYKQLFALNCDYLAYRNRAIAVFIRRFFEIVISAIGRFHVWQNC